MTKLKKFNGKDATWQICDGSWTWRPWRDSRGIPYNSESRGESTGTVNCPVCWRVVDLITPGTNLGKKKESWLIEQHRRLSPEQPEHVWPNGWRELADGKAVSE